MDFNYLDYLFNALIIILMFLSWINAKTMRSIANDNKKISMQMANIQETGIKIHVLPNIKKILTNLNQLTQFDYFDYEEQVKNNHLIWSQLNQVIFYFNETDEIYKSIDSLYEDMWDLTGKIGERDSIIKRGKKENMEDYSLKSKEISTDSKEIFNKVQKIKKDIIKRFRIEMKVPNNQ